MIGIGILVLVQIVFLAALGWIWLGRRPTPARFATAQGITIDGESLPLVASALRRTYLGRVVGTPAGGLTLVAIGWIFGLRVTLAYLALLGFVGGTMIGVVLAQHRRSAAPGSVRQASLTARTVADYSPRYAAWSIAILAVVCAGGCAVVALTAPAGLGAYAGVLVIAAAAVLVVPLGQRLQRRVVEAPRGEADPTVDDALRATAVRTVHHAVLGILCCGILLASLTGALTRTTLAVLADGHVLFQAPPGSTSISVDTGLRQSGHPNAPVRITWTEADGSDHEKAHVRAVGAVYTTSIRPSGLPLFVGSIGLLVTIAAFVEWSRATSAWKRRGPRHSPDAPSTAAVPGDALAGGGT